MKRTLALVLGAALGFAAIQTDARQPVAPGTASTDIVAPSTTAGKQLAWFLDYLHGAEQTVVPVLNWMTSGIARTSSLVRSPNTTRR